MSLETPIQYNFATKQNSNNLSAYGGIGKSDLTFNLLHSLQHDKINSSD